MIADSITPATYTSLGLGMVVRITYPQPSVWLDLWGGTSGTFNGIDRFNRVIDQRWQNNTGSTPADIDRYGYGYDLNSNRLWKQKVVATGLDELYAYDPLNRLTQMQRGTLNSAKTSITGTIVREMDYTLDATGNWNAYVTATAGTTDLNQTRTQNMVNEITAIAASGGTPVWATPAYDPAGNMTTMPQVATPTSSFTATYDAWNQMTSLSDSSGVVANYKYDGRNRRIVKVTAATSETRHFYYTDSWQDIEERVGTSTSMDTQYVWGVRYIDELVCRDDATSTPARRLYACQDANFNLTAIADAGGNIAERYLFDPYGNRTILSASWAVLSATAYAWIVGHQGLMHDPETGLVYNRYRYLHGAIGRFGSRDPLEYIDGMNSYEYEASDSVATIDAYGNQTKPTTKPAEPKGDGIYGTVVCDGNGGYKAVFNPNGDIAELLTLPCIKDIVAAHEQIHIDDWKKKEPNACRKNNLPNGTPLPADSSPVTPDMAGKTRSNFVRDSEKRAWTDSLTRIRNLLDSCKFKCALGINDQGEIVPVKVDIPDQRCCDWAKNLLNTANIMSQTGIYKN